MELGTGILHMDSVSQMFDQALQHHRAGNLHQAELLYRQILEQDPRHFDALHLLGVIAHQVGRNESAVECIREALRLAPGAAEAHSNLGSALMALGRWAEAAASYRRALGLKPDFVAAYLSLGHVLLRQGKFDEAIAGYQQAARLQPENVEAHVCLGNAWHESGRRPEAVASYRQALQLRPDLAEAHYNLGLVLHEQGMHDDATASYRHALRCQPNLAEAHNNLGNVCKEQGKLAEAVACYQQAVQLRPHFVHAHYNLGLVLREQKDYAAAVAAFEQVLRLQPQNVRAHVDLGNTHQCQNNWAAAVESYQQALRLQPDDVEAYCNMGSALQRQGKLMEAIASFQEALRRKPDCPEVYNNMGTALSALGRKEEAVASYRQALRLRPDLTVTYYNLGSALSDQAKLEEAGLAFQEALRLQPDHPDVYNNLGNLFKDQGRLDEGIAAYRQALEFAPDSVIAHDNLVFIQHFHPDYSAAALHEEVTRWNDRHAEPLARLRQPHANDRDADRRLRIGYVSADFHVHPVANFLLPLLSNHSRREVEVFCYAEVPTPDYVTERLRACADVWCSTVGVSDEQLAGMVRRDRIDILVDLALHTARNRLLVFARKPAPVQVTWLGYAGTTGLTAIDYRLTDPYLDPPGSGDEHYSEASFRLPETFWCYDPRNDLPMSPIPPVLRGKPFTFGCLNKICKVNDRLLALWAQIMRALPHARLLLYAPRGWTRDHVSARLEQDGVASTRVDFVDRQLEPDYLQVYNRIDLCLDCWPCNGGTTSLDALWMGVPVVTLVGQTVVGRTGWSVLCNLGLQELAAHTPEEYVALAVRLAGDLPRLQELRATMRPRLRESPLMDGKRFARNIEQAYRQMWRQWCKR